MPAKPSAYMVQSCFERYYVALVAFCSRLVSCEETARDLVQDVFLKLLDKPVQLPSEPDQIKSYLYTMVRNQALNYLRRKNLFSQYEQTSVQIAFEDSVLEAIIHAEQLQQLHEAVQNLPQACRSVCEQTYYEGLSNKEAAAFSGTSVNTVKTHKKRTLMLLRQQLIPTMRIVKSIFFSFF